MNPLNVRTPPAYRAPLWRLQDKLSPMEQADFQFSTLDDLHKAINEIQEMQIKNMQLRALPRLKRFLEAMGQYGKVIEVFLNTTNILAFVWGPMKLILQTARNYADVFEMVVDTYQTLGECLPHFQQYEALFRNSPDMQKVLEYVYEDILDFHRKALKIFRHRAWYYLFRCTWKGLLVSLREICDNLRRHKSLVETQANIEHYRESQREHKLIKEESVRTQQAEQRRRMAYIIEWLSSADYKNDHERYLEIRKQYPQTGQWLLKATKVKKWLTPSTMPEPWQIWLYGIPGAGKTVLASMLIEEVKQRQMSTSSVHSTRVVSSVQYAYFYCRHGNPEKGSFQAITGALISQIVRQNPDSALISLLYEKIISTGDTKLSSKSEAEELLKTALAGSSASHTYLILDGLDECETPEDIISLITTLNRVTEPLNIASPGAYRLLFTSTNENIIRKQLSKAVKLQIRPKDNGNDIKHYTSTWSSKIQEKFGLSDSERSSLEDNVFSKANGMFLFCVLVLQNFLGQSTRQHFYREMAPDTFPSGLKDVYSRIFTRIDSRNMYPSQRESAFKIMGLLACSRRPLKRYEVQGFFATDEDGTVDYENRSLRDDIKDLCGCLVEVYAGDSIDFVHTTLKQYITQQKPEEVLDMERSLTTLCIRHLSFKCYSPDIESEKIKDFILKGYYALLEYAAIHWVDHLRSYLTGLSSGSIGVAQVTPVINDFFDMFWNEDTIIRESSISSEKDFDNIENSPELFQKLVHINSLTVQLRNGEVEPSNGPLSCLSLESILLKVRAMRENVHSDGSDDVKQILDNIYGPRIYKCFLYTCQYFSEGFTSCDARDAHQNQHSHRYLCPEPGCDMGTIGYGTFASLKLHMDMDHTSNYEPENQLITFPTFKGTGSGMPEEVNEGSRLDHSKSLYGHGNDSQSGTSTLKSYKVPKFLQPLLDSLPKFQIIKSLRSQKKHRSRLCYLLANPGVSRTCTVDLLHPSDLEFVKDTSLETPSVNFSSDGHFLVASWLTIVEIIEVASGKQHSVLDIVDFQDFLEQYEITIDDMDPSHVCFSPDNKFLALHFDFGVVVWDIGKARVSNFIGLKPGFLIIQFEFVGDSKRMVTIMGGRLNPEGMLEHYISVWDLGTVSERMVFQFQRYYYDSFATTISPSGRYIAARVEAWRLPVTHILIWDIVSEAQKRIIVGNRSNEQSLDHGHDKMRLGDVNITLDFNSIISLRFTIRDELLLCGMQLQVDSRESRLLKVVKFKLSTIPSIDNRWEISITRVHEGTIWVPPDALSTSGIEALFCAVDHLLQFTIAPFISPLRFDRSGRWLFLCDYHQEGIWVWDLDKDINISNRDEPDLVLSGSCHGKNRVFATCNPNTSDISGENLLFATVPNRDAIRIWRLTAQPKAPGAKSKLES